MVQVLTQAQPGSSSQISLLIPTEVQLLAPRYVNTNSAPDLKGKYPQDVHGSPLLRRFIDTLKVGFYENASNFAVYNPIMGENIQLVQIQADHIVQILRPNGGLVAYNTNGELTFKLGTDLRNRIPKLLSL